MEVAKKYFPGVPVVAIGNAVFPAKYQAAPGGKKEKHLISCVGNVSGRKNQKLLVHAFAELADRYPSWNVEFWGEKSSHYARSMEEEIKAKHLEGRILLKGKTNRNEEVYRRSDIFCIPSTSEGFPQGLAEAMSAGLPCVGLKTCGGTNELIQEGKTGFLVDNDQGILSEALSALMDDGDLRIRMGKAGHELVQQYKPDRMWTMWEELIQKASKV